MLEKAMLIWLLLTEMGIVVSQANCGPPALAATSTRSRTEFVWPLTAAEKMRQPAPQPVEGSANFNVTR